MPVRVELVEPAFGDLVRYAKAGNVRLFLAKLLRIEEHGEDAGYRLGRGLTGWRKTIVGDRDWRIIFRMNGPGTVATIWVIGDRADSECYAEAERRIRTLDPNAPGAMSLAAALVRLTEHQRLPRR